MEAECDRSHLQGEGLEPVVKLTVDHGFLIHGGGEGLEGEVGGIGFDALSPQELSHLIPFLLGLFDFVLDIQQFRPLPKNAAVDVAFGTEAASGGRSDRLFPQGCDRVFWGLAGFQVSREPKLFLVVVAQVEQGVVAHFGDVHRYLEWRGKAIALMEAECDRGTWISLCLLYIAF